MTIKQHPTNPFQQRTLQRLFPLFMLSTVIILIGGGVALLWTNQQGHHNGQPAGAVEAAGDVSVTGPPTLSAATIDSIFARLGSPMVGTGKVVEQASRQTNVDDAFALGVWWTETNDGGAGVGLAYRNPGSVRGSVGYPSGSLGYTIYPSYTAAISYWFNLLRNNYVNRGLSTVYTIARPYVGTTSYPLWAGKVINLMFSYRGMAPPPSSVTPTPRPKPTIDPNIVVANLARQYKQRKLTPLLQSRSTSGLSPLPGQGLAQEMSQQGSIGTSQSDNPPPLPRNAVLIIVLFGLLTALAIAWYGLKLKVPVVDVNTESNQTEQAQFESPSLLQSDGETPSTDNLPVLPIDTRVPVHEGFAPSTDDLPVLPTPLPATSEQGRVTDALPRPIIALPAHTDTRTPVTIGAGAGTRSGGLLSRYGQNNNNNKTV
ncbi:MAG: hypothetical protein E6J33_05980 [Chloroflexi bacterium]|nr:MAG: hypothetical protein E6J33_05980 [Chloroflexota bacterium]